jgi:hypothetical protein
MTFYLISLFQSTRQSEIDADRHNFKFKNFIWYWILRNQMMGDIDRIKCWAGSVNVKQCYSNIAMHM